MLTSKKTMATRHLHNHEMKLLVQLLSLKTSHISSKEYKKQVKDLPRRLRCSVATKISGSSNLCTTHNGLNHYLINDIFSWVKHEFNKGIGRFLYPIIMSGKLTASEELQVRQLEPVLEMWHKDFTLVESAPLGHTPIDRGDTFEYAKTTCTACLLSRIGYDHDVVFALFVGMIGRFSCDQLFRVDFPLKELRSCHFEKIKSKRVRFVRYWLKSTRRGADAMPDTIDLGIKIKMIGDEVKWAKEVQPRTRPESFGGSTLREESVAPEDLGLLGELASYSDLNPFSYDEIDLKKEAKPYCATKDTAATHSTKKDDGKLSPTPRPQNLNRHSPLNDLGFKFKHTHIRDSNEVNHMPFHPPAKHDSVMGSTISSQTRIKSIAPLRINKHHHQQNLTPTPLLNPRAHIASSIYPTTSIASYNSPSSRTKPSQYLYDPLATSQEIVEKYRALLATNPFEEPERERHVLPKPSRLSMYSGFGGVGERDPFADVDVEGREDEVLEDGGAGGDGDGVGDGKVGEVSEAGTRWDDLYD